MACYRYCGFNGNEGDEDRVVGVGRLEKWRWCARVVGTVVDVVVQQHTSHLS